MKKTLHIFGLITLLATSCNQADKEKVDLPSDKVAKDTSANFSETNDNLKLLTQAYPDSNSLFKKYKDSNFYTTTLVSDNKVSYQKIDYEYIRRSDSIIVIHKDLLNDFLAIFLNNKNAFKDLFSNLMGVRTKYPADTNDFVLSRTKYKMYGVIHERTVIHGANEQIWQITTCDHIMSDNPCYVNIIFNYKNNKESNELLDLIYLKAQLETCEI
jgi:hypothetical protein